MEATSDACPSRRAGIRSTILLVGRRRVAGIAALQDRAQHPAVDQAGADAIDPHAGAGAFPRRALGQPDHRVLAGAVDRDIGDPIRPAIEAVLMMLPLFCFSITGSTCFMPRKTPTTLTSSTRRKLSSEYSGDRLDVALDAGVVVERVDGAELVDGGADIFRDLVLLGDVGGDRERLRPRPADP